MSTITLTSQFTSADLDALESLIKEHGEYVRGGGYVTFEQVVEQLQEARDRQREEESGAGVSIPGVTEATRLTSDQVTRLAYFLHGIAQRGGSVSVGELVTEIS